MDTIRTTVLCACCAAIGLTLAEQLLPLERFQKQIKLLLTILLLTAVLKPLTRLDLPGLTTDTNAAEQTMTDAAEQADLARKQAVAESILHALNRELETRDVPCRVTEVLLHITADGSIIINEVIIRGNAQTGRVYLREWLGDETTITEEVPASDCTDREDP